MTKPALTTAERALRVVLGVATAAWLAGALLYSFAGVTFAVTSAWRYGLLALLVLVALVIVVLVWRVALRRGALLGLGTLVAAGILFFGTCVGVLTLGGA